MNPPRRYRCEYKLKRSARKEAETDSDGLRCWTHFGCELLYVQGISDLGKEDVWAAWKPHAEEVLDSLAVFDDPNDIDSSHMAIVDVDEEGRPGSILISPTIEAEVGASIQAEARGRDGILVWRFDSDRPGRIPLVKSDSANYFRKAMISGDVFSKFENLYRTCEFVGSRLRSIDPDRRTRYGAEHGTLLCAVEHAFSSQTIRWQRVAARISALANANPDKLGEIVADHLYDLRKRVVHAKDSTSLPRAVPFKDESILADALPLLESLARRLIELERQRFSEE